MSICSAAHYKNLPNDLQMLSDAPSHSVYVLLLPCAERDRQSLSNVLAVVQVALEGKISRKSVEAQLARGNRLAGDLISWSVCQQFGDPNIGRLSGAQVVRIAVHPSVHGIGYGTRAMEQLYRFFNGEMIDLTSGGGLATRTRRWPAGTTPAETRTMTRNPKAHRTTPTPTTPPAPPLAKSSRKK